MSSIPCSRAAAASASVSSGVGGPWGVGSSGRSAGRLCARTKRSKSPRLVITSQRAPSRDSTVGVRHALGGEDRLAGADLHVSVSGAHAELTFEHVKGLVLGLVDVERGRVSVRSKRLHHRDSILAFVVADANGVEGVQEPQLLGGCRCGRHDDYLLSDKLGFGVLYFFSISELCQTSR
jgi:hypothetical protein